MSLIVERFFIFKRRSADCGDYVVVTNARHIKVTGKKAQQLVYRHHTMYPGGLKEIQYKDMMRRKPDEVRGMWCFHSPSKPKSRLADYSPSCLWYASQKQVARTEA